MLQRILVVACLSICGAVGCQKKSTNLTSNAVSPEASTQKGIVNSVGMKLLLVTKGTFTMGSPDTEVGRNADERQHQVTLSSDFYLGVTEVTQAQYGKVMGNNPSFFTGEQVKGDSSNYPVERVSWADAVEFCKRLSELPEEKKAGRVYRLPTEAEWEYACRAGSQSAYSFGADRALLDGYAWLADNAGGKTHPVGEKKPNAWGFFDMHGNLFEWCGDWYGEYPQTAVTDPVGPSEGSQRVTRSGGWRYLGEFCRSANRNYRDPTNRFYNFGFRVAVILSEDKK